jgi:hypothetical protein
MQQVHGRGDVMSTVRLSRQPTIGVQSPQRAHLGRIREVAGPLPHGVSYVARQGSTCNLADQATWLAAKGGRH